MNNQAPRSVSDTARRILGAGALLAAFGFAILLVDVVVYGGFDTNVFGLRVRMHDPLRAALLASFALGVFAAAHGLARAWAAVAAGVAGLNVIALASAVVAVPVLVGIARHHVGGAVASGVLVLATCGLGRRLGSPRLGVMAAWLVATSPALFLMQASSPEDLAVAAGWTIGWYLLIGATAMSAVAAGAVVSMAMVLRPNLVPSAAVMLLWFAWRMRAAGPERARAGRQALGFAATAVQGAVVAWAITRQYLTAVEVPASPTWEAPGFLLPAWPLLMIGIAALVRLAMRSAPPAIKLFAAWLLIALGVYAVRAGIVRGLFG